jgi:hypothetical protein
VTPGDFDGKNAQFIDPIRFSKLALESSTVTF